MSNPKVQTTLTGKRLADSHSKERSSCEAAAVAVDKGIESSKAAIKNPYEKKKAPDSNQESTNVAVMPPISLIGDKTRATFKQALNAYKTCRDMKDVHLVEFNKITPSNVLSTMKTFATAIGSCSKWVSADEMELYKPSTLLLYFNSIRTHLSREDTLLECMAEGSPIQKEIARIAKNLNSRLYEVAYNEGTLEQNSKNNTRRNVFAVINLHVLKNPPRNKTESKAWLNVHVLNTVRNAVGRSGEARFFKLEDGDFNPDDQVFRSVWFQRKSKRIQVMAFAHDNEWQLDFHTTFAAYLITNRDEVLAATDPTDGTHWMFPHLAAMKNVESVNQYVTDTLRSCVGHVRGVDDKTASHNIRYGAMDDLNACMLLDVVACLQRGDWYFTGDSAGFHYLMSLRNDLMASRALAGHVEPTAKVFLPDYTRVASELGEDIIAKLESISKHLFASLPFSEKPMERLFHYRKILLSVIIVALPQIKEALGKDSLLVLTVTGEAARNSLHWKDLMSIRDLLLANVKALNKIELVNVRTATQQELQDLRDEVKDLQNEIQVQSKGIADLSSKVDKVTNLLSKVLDSNLSPQVPPSHHNEFHQPLAVEFHRPLAVSPAVSQEEREESPLVRKSRKPSSDIISEKEMPTKKLKVAKQQVSIAALLSAGQSVKFSPKCFTNFTSMTISTVVKEVLLQDVDVKVKTPVDNIKGNDKGRMKRLFRFIALFCNKKEYNLFSGRNRPYINRSNEAEFEQKKKEYNEIASSLEKRVIEYMNDVLEKEFDSKTLNVSKFRRFLEDNKYNIPLKANAESWETVEAYLNNKWKDTGNK